MMNVEERYKQAVKALEDAQRALGAIPRTDPDARFAATLTVETAVVVVRATKAVVKAESRERNFAGIGSPLHVACVERFDDEVVTALEQRAVQLQEAWAARRAQAAARALDPQPPASSERATRVQVRPMHGARPPVEVIRRWARNLEE